MITGYAHDYTVQVGEPVDKITIEVNMASSYSIENLPFEITETDRQNLVRGDEKFQPLTWDELREIIGNARYDCSADNCS